MMVHCVTARQRSGIYYPRVLSEWPTPEQARREFDRLVDSPASAMWAFGLASFPQEEQQSGY